MTAVIDAAVVLAPVGPADGPALDDLMTRCSLRSRYARFFSPVRVLPPVYRAAILAGDPIRHDALVARWPGPDGAIVGLASLANGPDAAELGILIEDAWQGRGIGTTLVRQLLTRARSRGVHRIDAVVLPASTRLLGWLGRLLPLEHSELTGDSAIGRFRLL
jgi:GNAT superfamily N-acetyltransferase